MQQSNSGCLGPVHILGVGRAKDRIAGRTAGGHTVGRMKPRDRCRPAPRPNNSHYLFTCMELSVMVSLRSYIHVPLIMIFPLFALLN